MAVIKVPELAESITEGTIVQWFKKAGDLIVKGDYIAELETDKVNIEIISEYSGILYEVKAMEGSTVKVGEVIAVIKENEEQVRVTMTEKHKEAHMPESPALEKKPPPDQTGAMEKRHQIVSPAARKLAREKGINLNNVPTIDPLGRIRLQDVQRYEAAVSTQSTMLSSEETKKILKVEERSVERIRMSRRRQTIARNLVDTKQNTAMLTTFNEIDMTDLISFRNNRKKQFFQEFGVKLGYMSFFTKAAVAALKKFPLLNAEIQYDEILIKKYYDIGIAVSTNQGLVVPVVRNADNKNVAEIEMAIFELAEKARNNSLEIRDLQGGTFTITNGGIFGSLLSTPILNGPQSAILGMHAIQLRPTAIDAERMENRQMMYVALTYDHRLIDGKEAVSFLKHIKSLIEDPESLLFA
ncbi:2-oxoglutarate dehydrogenase complex dihydrolipoyllysine-residue succinyltransferase [Niallia endozanthoxylica]|uniref:Dihydrolipoyllysine-residue succinyltransferase component of 2-oxoglutarate dehydrogenase complex n=1 Tax=Niallia endozanthoxylica TaxID=2036016 RepID=A0A5J5HWF0_9BACI|nr:2-oxoglutarate dehydrogenase complex dihydrolipoyllysine-residue succinyltransferase [Niallia endozanthoxylica]KAA9026441.1 2-oxoglutarate dehydrogenase complex dihydrolipoyllysine-residue succinyltransferase [Niallia endozanthoxylica]